MILVIACVYTVIAVGLSLLSRKIWNWWMEPPA